MLWTKIHRWLNMTKDREQKNYRKCKDMVKDKCQIKTWWNRQETKARLSRFFFFTKLKGYQIPVTWMVKLGSKRRTFEGWNSGVIRKYKRNLFEDPNSNNIN
jgi:hypothetical protein